MSEENNVTYNQEDIIIYCFVDCSSETVISFPKDRKL